MNITVPITQFHRSVVLNHFLSVLLDLGHWKGEHVIISVRIGGCCATRINKLPSHICKDPQPRPKIREENKRQLVARLLILTSFFTRPDEYHQLLQLRYPICERLLFTRNDDWHISSKVTHAVTNCFSQISHP